MFVFLCFFFLLVCFSCFYSSSVFDYYLDRCGLDFSEGLMMVDGVSLFCLLMLFFCGFVALYFCIHYFFGDLVLGFSLFSMLFLFLGVMGFLVFSYSFLVTLIFWEYLGVVSFFLILFYSNLDSLRGTMMTLFASRFGDVCFFGLIVFFCFLWDCDSFFLCFILLFMVLSKSACFPFISWLLEAMRAPTPVSSLVHSSTLVAAGVWFLFRYGGSVFHTSFSFEFVLFVLSLSTVVISSFCSLVFFDLKKIVALSTCKNVSWCIIFFLFGDVFLGLFQLLSHGVAKCYLFISLGDLMSGSSSAQDSRGVFCSSYKGLSSVLLQGVLVLSLCGAPFLGVFFSKHGLLCYLLWGCSPICFITLFFCFILSFAYSFRLLGLLCGFISFGVYMFGSCFLVIFVLSILSSVMKSFLFGSSDEVFLVSFISSLFLLFCQILGIFLGVYFYFYPLSRGVSILGLFIWGCDGLVGFFYSVYNYIFIFFLFLLYRWEFSVLSWSYGLLVSVKSYFVIGWDSLKFLVLCGVFLICLCFVFI